MRVVVALLAALVVAMPALAVEGEPVVRDCSTRALGDLGRDWRKRAVVAGPLAFVGMKNGVSFGRAAPKGRAWPVKVLVVVEPREAVSVTIEDSSRAGARLGYAPRGLPRAKDGSVAPEAGSETVFFQACPRPNPNQKPWNRGTQFPGYFLVARPSCVRITVQMNGPQLALTLYRRTLRFGVASCAR